MEKYFNEGNDCDICRHQYLCGRDGDAIGCRRRDAGMRCNFEERDIRMCPVCEKEVDREDMNFTRDCHGIAYRLVCNDCYDKLMEKGYDGRHYDELDECLDYEY